MMIIKYCIYTSFNDHHQENIDGQTKINNNKIIESKKQKFKKKMPTGHLCVCDGIKWIISINSTGYVRHE